MAGWFSFSWICWFCWPILRSGESFCCIFCWSRKKHGSWIILDDSKLKLHHSDWWNGHAEFMMLFFIFRFALEVNGLAFSNINIPEIWKASKRIWTDVVAFEDIFSTLWLQERSHNDRLTGRSSRCHRLDKQRRNHESNKDVEALETTSMWCGATKNGALFLTPAGVLRGKAWKCLKRCLQILSCWFRFRWFLVVESQANFQSSSYEPYTRAHVFSFTHQSHQKSTSNLHGNGHRIPKLILVIRVCYMSLKHHL